MKNILFLILIIPAISHAQDSTWVTSLSLKAKTIKLLAGRALQSNDTAVIKVFIKWGAEFKTNNPTDNANVTIDSATTLSVKWMYRELLALPAGFAETDDFIQDFVTSVTAKRVANSYLDDLLTALETAYANLIGELKQTGSDLMLKTQ